MPRRFTQTEVFNLAVDWWHTPGSGDSTRDLRDFLDEETGGRLSFEDLDRLDDLVREEVGTLWDRNIGAAFKGRE